MRIWLDKDKDSLPISYLDDSKNNGYDYAVPCTSFEDVKYFIIKKEAQFDFYLAGDDNPFNTDLFNNDVIIDIMVTEISISDEFDKDEIDDFIQWLNNTRRDKYNIEIGYH